MSICILGVGLRDTSIPSVLSGKYIKVKTSVISEKDTDLFLFLTNSNRVCYLSKEHLVTWRTLGDEVDVDGTDPIICAYIENGLLYHKKETSIKKVGGATTLCLNICHSCNMNCTYCYANAGTYG